MGNTGLWLGAVCTIAIYSFLYGDNPVFRFFENLFVGLGAAHMSVMGYESIMTRAWKPMLAGNYWWAGSIVLGFMLLARLIPATRWVSRIPLGFMMGVAAAFTARRAINTEFWVQMRSTMNIQLNSINSILYLVAVIAVVSYFLFTYNPDKPWGRALGAAGKFGQYVMMIAFGASLGNTIMARLSLVIGRMEFLFRDVFGVLQ